MAWSKNRVLHIKLSTPIKGRLHEGNCIHQTEAIKASLDDEHTLVCTGTGSGKSICFLLPILSRVMKSDMDASSLDHRMELMGPHLLPF